jgi:hypothetical protein
MKLYKTVFLTLVLFHCSCKLKPQAASDLLLQPEKWTVFNRDIDLSNGVFHLDARENDGVLWLNDYDFQDGTIELDIKGRDLQGQSFVGVAFNGQDNEHYDAVYFRPFNFENPERREHSVQYIALPAYDWSVLREATPGKYENFVKPVPRPDHWFHARIEIGFPRVSVFINGASSPSLEVDQINLRGHGKIGLWVGNGSEGWFKNISVRRKFKEPPRTVLMDLGHAPRFYNDPFNMDKEDEQFERVQYMTYELVRSVASANAQLGYISGKISRGTLDDCDALFIHVPSSRYHPSEVEAIQRYVDNGGSLFLVMDVDFWSTLGQTNVNDLIAPYGIQFGGTIPDSLAGGTSRTGAIHKNPLKITYHGGRMVEGGTPFCYGKESMEYPFGVYHEPDSGGRIVVMGDAMTSLYMTSWEGVTDYQCQEFMQDVFRWLLR